MLFLFLSFYSSGICLCDLSFHPTIWLFWSLEAQDRTTRSPKKKKYVYILRISHIINISIYKHHAKTKKKKKVFLSYLCWNSCSFLTWVCVIFEVYARPRVRIKEQQQEEDKAENHFSPPDDKGSILFLRVLQSLSLPDSSSTST